VRDALEAITETLLRFADVALNEGVSGIFYSIQAASRSAHAEAVYDEFGEPYDRRGLQSVGGRPLLALAHRPRGALLSARPARLPGHAWNWDDRRTPPALCTAQRLVPGAVIGGLDQWATLRDGSPEAAVAEATDAVAQTDGVGLIVGPGCVLAMNTPDDNVAAVVRALGGPLKPVPGVRPPKPG